MIGPGRKAAKTGRPMIATWVSRLLRAVQWRYNRCAGAVRRLLTGGRWAHIITLRCSYTWHWFSLWLLRQSFRSCRLERKIIGIALVEHMGDIVACEPVARYMRQLEPDAFLIWLVRPPYADLVRYNPHVDRTVAVVCLQEVMELERAGLFDDLRCLHPHGRVCGCCGVPLVKANSDITLDNYYEHGTLLQSFCLSSGLPALAEAPTIYIPESITRRVNRLGLPQRFVVVHCSCGVPERSWPGDKWERLVAELLLQFPVAVVEVGHKGIVAGCRSGRFLNLAGKLSVLETAEVIRRASLFVGADSGPAHLANAVETPGVLLLGHYQAFARYLPYTGCYSTEQGATLLYADGPASILPEDSVIAAVVARLRGTL